MKKSKEFGVIVCEHILDNSRVVKLVVHNYDSIWEFMCGESDHLDYKKSKVIGINHLIDRDSSLSELKKLPIGHFAEKKEFDDDWEIHEFNEEE